MGLRTTVSEATVFLRLADGKAAKGSVPYEQRGVCPSFRQRCVVFKATKEIKLL